MKIKSIKLSPKISIGGKHSLVLFAGPCVIESAAGCMSIARSVKKITDELDVPYVFKASFDKANRTSVSSFRGPGLEKGLVILKRVKEELGLPVMSDVHCCSQVEAAATVLDVIQIPAFLCRQTDLLQAAAATGKPVNIKKGQFLAPGDVPHIIDKVYESGNKKVMLTERGSSFGYHNLVSDFRALPMMRATGCPVIFDGTHSVQLPGGAENASGGDRAFIEPLIRAAAAVGCDGIFMEVHPRPEKALCDSATMFPVRKLRKLLMTVKKIDGLV